MAKQIYLVTVPQAHKRAAEFALRQDADVWTCDTTDGSTTVTFTVTSTRRPEELQDCVAEVCGPAMSCAVRLAPKDA